MVGGSGVAFWTGSVAGAADACCNGEYVGATAAGRVFGGNAAGGKAAGGKAAGGKAAGGNVVGGKAVGGKTDVVPGFHGRFEAGIGGGVVWTTGV